MTPDADRSSIAAAAMRGVVGAMAMTGMRTVTKALGMLEESPPDAATRQAALPVLENISIDRQAASELVHWAFGAAAGAAFGALPTAVRRPALAGPVYGLAVWIGFEMTLAPLLGFPHARRRKVIGRVAVAADHALYGTVVGGRLR